MKPTFATLFLFVFFLMASKMQAQLIVIDELADSFKIEKFDDGGAISLADRKTQDFIIQVPNKLNVNTVKFKGDNGFVDAIFETGAPTGKKNYKIAKNQNYEKDVQEIQLIAAGKIHLNIIVLKKEPGDPAGGTTQPPPVAQCRLQNLARLNYRFIQPQVFASLSDDCNGPACKGCPDSSNAVIYDFATNKTYYGSNLMSAKRAKRSVKVGEPMEFRIRNVNPELYTVSISDSTVNRFQAMNSLIGLLSASNAIKGLSGNPSDIFAQSTGPDSCDLTADDSLTRAINSLARDLSFFNARMQELSPYYDAYCLRKLIMTVKAGIDNELNRQFGYRGIYTFYDLVYLVKINADNFKEGLAGALDDAYKKVLIIHYGYSYKVPRVANVDAIDFLFSVIPRNASAALPAVNKSSIRVHTRGGWKWDVSSGLYYAFGMQNDQFSIRTDSTIVPSASGVADSVIDRRGVLYRESKTGKGEFGFSSFIHFYPRFIPGFNISGIIGAGVSFQSTPQIRYFAGLGFLFGRDDRIGLNLGGVFGNVQELSDQYTKDASGNYRWLSAGEAGTAPVFKKHFVAKPFISLTYNLSFVKSKNDVIQAANTNTASAAQPEKAEDKKEKEE